jgi:hypothetical protein
MRPEGDFMLANFAKRRLRLLTAFGPLVPVSIILAGCAGSPIAMQKDARVRYEQSVEDYRACLSANGSNVAACENKRLIMETDEHALNTISASLPGSMSNSNNSTVTVQSR